MTWLLADIGGTNTRLALAAPDGPIHADHIANDDHGSFDALLDAHLPRGTAITAACIAAAGPVGPEAARLTNRDWRIERRALARRLQAPVTLMNDLGALAASVADLPKGALERLGPAPVDAQGQVTVLGFGTGVNMASARPDARGHPVVLDAELGHAALPATVAALLDDPPATVEEAFSGRGLARICGTSCPRAAATRPELAGPRATWARAAGQMCRELGWIATPRGGLLLAGSVFRAILASDARQVFLDHAAPHPRAGVDLGPLPLALIAEDAAALHGCRAVLKGRC